jgi:uncharacterized protein (TIGR03000 family)
MSINGKQARIGVWVAASAALLLGVAVGPSAGRGEKPAEGKRTASITLTVPKDAKVFFDGEPTDKTGSERQFTSPELEPGKLFHYNIVARWKADGKTVERARTVVVSAGAKVAVDFVAPPAGPKDREKDEQSVTSKAEKRVRATRVDFKKAFGLPFESLGTLGSRIEAARRKPDPVALGHAASELAVAEKVSKKKAALTSAALLEEAGELARQRRQSAELLAYYTHKFQMAEKAVDLREWNEQLGFADYAADQEREAGLGGTPPPDTSRRVLLNNRTTQHIDL